MTLPMRLLAPLLVALLLVVSACGGSDDTEKKSAGSDSTSGASASDCTYTEDGSEASKEAALPPGTPPSDQPAEMTITTEQGPVKVTLDAEKAPCTVNSFVALAKQKYFDATTCHRLTGGMGLSVLQCGDPSASGRGGPGYAYEDELIDNDPRLQPCEEMGPDTICTYPAGTVAMANSGPDTNGSQFFLVYEDSMLPNAYTVFGSMDAAGLAVVKQIAAGGADQSEKPNTPAGIVTVQ